MSGEYDIKTDPTVLPVQHGRWKVPIEYKEEIQKELGEMVCQEIITKQTEPTPWVSSLTYLKKANSKLRICLNPKDLNKAIIHENHKAPTLEEIAHVLTGATKFSKVDGNKAFFGMHLTEAASLLTTFNTHLGRYRFLCVPFGLKMSQDIFQMRMDDIIAQCPGVLAIHDDVFIYGKDNKDHDANIINLFNIAQKEGLSFQQWQMLHQTRLHDILWWCVLSQGILTRSREDPRHHRDDTPSDETGATIIFRSSKLSSNIHPHLSHHTEPLHALLKKENSFTWDENSNTSFQKIKSLLEKALLKPLRYYNRNKPVTLQCDILHSRDSELASSKMVIP